MEIDIDSLARVRSWAEQRIAAEERRQQLAPLLSAMKTQMRSMQFEVVPSWFAGPSADFRSAVEGLEHSLITKEGSEDERSKILLAAQERTAALRDWLASI